jgi:hypothetical protein
MRLVQNLAQMCGTTDFISLLYRTLRSSDSPEIPRILWNLEIQNHIQKRPHEWGSNPPYFFSAQFNIVSFILCR